jgi:transposase InsO family protein
MRKKLDYCGLAEIRLLMARKPRVEVGRVFVDNGPEFAGTALDAWAVQHGVHLHFIQLGKRCRMPLSRA